MNKLKEYYVQITKIRLSTFKILGYSGIRDEQQILRSVREQNNILEEKDIFRLPYIKKVNRPSAPSLLFSECSPSLFRKLMYTNRIHIQWGRYPIYEALNVMRCFKCQQHYRKTETCTNKQVCEHRVEDCPKRHKKCINCVTTNDKYKLNYNVNHKASDRGCPSVEQNEIKN